MLTLADLTEPAPEAGPSDWNADGVEIIERLIPDDLLDAYCAEWKRENNGEGAWADARKHGWPGCTPYMENEALRNLLLHPPLARVLADIVGEPMGVHLNLTGWQTTERDWHQDGYLNDAWVGDAYAAVWIALDDIHPDSGPFQYVPGSHRWPQVTYAKMADHYDMTDPHWPKASEATIAALFADDIARRDAHVVDHLPERGDVLVWHARLLHRGSRARVPGSLRPALIAHFSGIHHRPDFPPAVQTGGGWLFPIREFVPVR